MTETATVSTVDAIARAIGDPGSVLPRIEGESVTRWSARAVEQLLNPPCVMTHTPPMDFAQCETHDTTFPLGETCKFDGREPWQVFADEADEQRGLKVRAEQRLAIAVGHGYRALNPKQQAAIDRMEVEVKERYDLHCATMHYHFDEQYRPGYDRMARVTWSDGERLAQATIDRHGNGDYWIADLDLIHNGHDDQCGCEHCVAYRDDDD